VEHNIGIRVKEDNHLPETSFVSNIHQQKDYVEHNIGIHVKEDNHLAETSFVSNIHQPKDNVEHNIGINVWCNQPFHVPMRIFLIQPSAILANLIQTIYSTVPCAAVFCWTVCACIASSVPALTKRRELHTAAHRVVTYCTAVCSTGILWHACCIQVHGTGCRITMQHAICK
jgi:hypothetical protein